MIDSQKAKEEPELFAVLGTEKITDLHSLDRAKKIAEEVKGKVWVMIRMGEDIQFIYPV